MAICDFGWSCIEDLKERDFIRGRNKPINTIEKAGWGDIRVPEEIPQRVVQLTNRNQPQGQAIVDWHWLYPKLPL